MTHASRIFETYRIPFQWHLEIVAFYVLRVIGITYKTGVNKLRFYVHLIKANGRVLSTDDGHITCKYSFRNRELNITLRIFPSSDPEVFEQVFINEEYAPVIELSNGSGENLTMIDAGANIGLTAIYFKMCFNDIKVIAIEPDSENFRLLVKNLEANQISTRHCLNAALWSASIPLKTGNAFRDGKSWSITVEEAGGSDSALEGVTLPALFQQFDLQFLDVLKIDIEGAEKYVFEDHDAIEPLLKKTKYLAVEIHDEVCDRAAIENFLVRTGITVFHHGELTIGENKGL